MPAISNIKTLAREMSTYDHFDEKYLFDKTDQENIFIEVLRNAKIEKPSINAPLKTNNTKSVKFDVSFYPVGRQ